MKLLILFAVLATAAASCENGCSGHGHCGLYDICQCYGNWEGNDCSGRVCPYEKAWVDTAIATDDAHNYARCANKGECDGKSGQCKCWEPFGGKGCRRMECPNACSGHGTCEYISELAANNDCEWDNSAYAARTNCVHASVTSSPAFSDGTVTYGKKHASTDVPSVWDAQKIQGCQCDPGYEGADCSSRICPSGNDPLRHLDASNAAQVAHKFTLTIDGNDGQNTAWVVTERGNVATTDGTPINTAETTTQVEKTDGMGPPTFVLAFTDTYGEKWLTRPIPLNVKGSCDDEQTCPLEDRNGWNADNGKADGSNADASVPIILGHNIRHALLDLPNGAVTGEDVDPRTGEKDAGALTVACAVAGSNNLGFTCTIEFKSAHNSGDLTNKLECWSAGCTHVGASTSANPGGCSPKYTGLPGAGSCSVADTTVGTSNLDTCSGRGACNGADGLCECYEGFTDEDCSVQTVLV